MDCAIVAIELKGFAQMAEGLALRLDDIGLDSTRVRTAARTFVEQSMVAAESATKVSPSRKVDIGGDTWYLTFGTVTEGARYGAAFLSAVLDLVVNRGLFYLKPSLAITWGTPRMSGARFLDDGSIEAYRTADSGEPFAFVVLPAARERFGKEEQGLLESRTRRDKPVTLLKWDDYVSRLDGSGANTALLVSSLLTDDEVLHFQTNSDILKHVIMEQSVAKVVRIVGGAVRLDNLEQFEYARASIGLVRTGHAECVIHNYFTLIDSVPNYVWLRACRRLVREHPTKFVYSAYILPKEALRPLSYHLYDDVAMLFLRSYNEMRDVVTMAGSLLIRNTQVAQRLRLHFSEDFKIAKRFDDSAFADFETRFSFSAETIEEGNKLLERLFA